MNQKTSNPQESIDAAEWKTRVDLAAAYRLAYRFGLSDIIWNHITAKIPNSQQFLINRFGLRYDEVTASNLIKVNQFGECLDAGDQALTKESINTTGFIIHSGIHAAHEDIQCVMHAHTDAGMAVSVLDEGLIPMVLDAMVFYDRVAYHRFQGASIDHQESQDLVKSLGHHRAMILKHHGLLTCGETIGGAFVKMFYLERACRVQISVQSSGQPYSLPSNSICEKTAKDFAHFQHGQFEWPALLRLLDREEPDYAE